MNNKANSMNYSLNLIIIKEEKVILEKIKIINKTIEIIRLTHRNIITITIIMIIIYTFFIKEIIITEVKVKVIII